MGIAAGRFFDGLSAARHKVDVQLDEDAGEIVITGDTLSDTQRWPLKTLRALEDHPGSSALQITQFTEEGDENPREAARLTLRDKDMTADLKRLCPDLFRRDVAKGTSGKVLRYGAAAILAVVLMLFVILPRMADTLATLIPVEKEIALGKSVMAQIERALGSTELGELQCSNAEGLAALDKLMNRLTQDQAFQYRIDVSVFDHKMMNAFAAPGGQVVLMRGLLDQASGPDAVAAVLAHEIGHVENRDPTRHALRSVGSAGLLSMVLGDFTGGAIVAFLSEQLLQASYTREAEMNADVFALDVLNSAKINSSGMAEFFDHVHTLEDQLPEIAAYFATHPASDERAELARENALAQVNVSPSLNNADWRALQGICN